MYSGVRTHPLRVSRGSIVVEVHIYVEIHLVAWIWTRSGLHGIISSISGLMMPLCMRSMHWVLRIGTINRRTMIVTLVTAVVVFWVPLMEPLRTPSILVSPWSGSMVRSVLCSTTRPLTLTIVVVWPLVVLVVTLRSVMSSAAARKAFVVVVALLVRLVGSLAKLLVLLVVTFWARILSRLRVTHVFPWISHAWDSCKIGSIRQEFSTYIILHQLACHLFESIVYLDKSLIFRVALDHGLDHIVSEAVANSFFQMIFLGEILDEGLEKVIQSLLKESLEDIRTSLFIQVRRNPVQKPGSQRSY